MPQKEEIKITRDKIVERMRTFPQRLLEQKKKLGQKLAFVEDEEIKIADAQDLE